MLYLLFAVLAGLALPGFLPSLLSLWLIFAAQLLAVALAFVHRSRRVKHLLFGAVAFCSGLAWATYYGEMLVAELLPGALVGKDIQVRGAVSDVDSSSSRRLRFLLAPQPGLQELPSRLQLSWYGSPDWARQLKEGDTISVRVRLKRPRSFINPTGFDYRLWQLRRGVGATGYVRSDGPQELLARADKKSLRGQLRQWLAEAKPNNLAILRALLLGERDLITDSQWQLFRATGTSHLIAISGLHIGLAAGLGYALGLLLGRGLILLWPVPAVIWAMLLGALSAWAYAALAGFALPTQRALAMLLLFYLARGTGRLTGGAGILLLAAVVVLTLEPLSVLDAGFWLSFLAVGALVMVFSGVVSLRKSSSWRLLWRPQWVAFIALLLPLALFFNHWSIVSPLANIIAITLVSVWVVPWLFAAALSSAVLPFVAALCLYLADQGLNLLWWWLDLLLNTAEALSLPVQASIYLHGLAPWLLGLACILLLLPPALRLRPLGCVLVISACSLPAVPAPPLRLIVLDVGQGLAAVVMTESKTLVYDTGPWFGEGFNAGADIIAPYLLSQGRTQVDALVVSHSHSDHAGGVQGLMESLSVNQVYAGEPIESLEISQYQNCHTSPDWEWQGVRFEFLSAPGRGRSEGNNASCVLAVHGLGKTLLLPGDIEKQTEALLVSQLDPVDVLLAPHHGSASSSSWSLLSSVRPGYAVFSAGFKNRHGHPHPDVVARYRKLGSTLFNTAEDGALEFVFPAVGPGRVISWREKRQRYWRD
ncbi:DNA internalization-related competence protein ComEC/Rec2 [Gilvimarinus sp. DA14]|uniref:DNA internalization-related competence protein ComEC/Rec2 n=1 Tax=Gilvimarinus sp. DA14 TaxID=2956798 RepID=UPI0020B82431|nr:DNA internalization-related competence protein ComEC/Rec2 [Gilvimarinus sp. DA14]UTF60919.1 DNA internalization-related competence protein ComEC/Rec2 [Gilvimarinus sp. DA14]